jgi:hypothetical protein
MCKKSKTLGSEAGQPGVVLNAHKAVLHAHKVVLPHSSVFDFLHIHGPMRMIASANFFATIRRLLDPQGELLCPDADERLVRDKLPPGNTNPGSGTIYRQESLMRPGNTNPGRMTLARITQSASAHRRQVQSCRKRPAGSARPFSPVRW